MPSLVFKAPATGRREVFELHKRITSIGSSADNDLAIAGGGLDDTHALIQFDGRTFVVQPLSRRGDSLVNGRKVKRHTLDHGDEIRFGQLDLTFQLYEETEDVATGEAADRLRSYEQIVAFSKTLLEAPDLATLLESMMDSVIAITEADKGFLILSEDDELHVKVARNIGRENIEDAISQFSDSIVATVLRERKPLIVSDALHDDQFSASRSVVNLKLCSVLCVPLLTRDGVQGLIYVGNDNVVNLFTQAHLDTLSIYASQATLIIQNALLTDELRLDNRALRERIEEMRFGTIIGACTPMQSVFRRVEKVAPTDVSVLIQGETGTGKELIAREIHDRSNRAKGPFVTINCGAIPENLLESELFGHVRGAFTGATNTRAGKFQAADGGTLFLDEIGEMPINLQVKILRALQDRRVTRVGENRAEDVDIRVVAATNRNLTEAISDGEFREDLYYRLNVVSMTLPPLRERGDDVVLIARYYLERYAREYGVGNRKLSKASVIALRKYTWPGNIRQLENHIKKAVILSEGTTIKPADLDLSPERLTRILPLNDAREIWQRDYILEALAVNEGNRTRAAKDLGVDPRTVFRFLEKEQGRDEEA